MSVSVVVVLAQLIALTVYFYVAVAKRDGARQ
jgi:hypothetical protein